MSGEKESVERVPSAITIERFLGTAVNSRWLARVAVWSKGEDVYAAQTYGAFGSNPGEAMRRLKDEVEKGEEGWTW